MRDSPLSLPALSHQDSTTTDVSSQLQKRDDTDEEEVHETSQSMDMETGSSADAYQWNHLHFPDGRWDGEDTWINDKLLRDKWMNRRVILFNKDADGALDLVRYYMLKEEQSPQPPIKTHAHAFQVFWARKAASWSNRPTGPLYEKHRQELINHLQNKVNRYTYLHMPTRRAKWQELLDALVNEDINKIKQVDSDYHSKALKAMQNRKEWFNGFHGERRLPYGQDPHLKLFSNADKSTLLVGPMNSQSSNLENEPMLRAFREYQEHGPFHLQDFEHEQWYATNKERIYHKANKSTATKENRKKWLDRFRAIHQGEDDDLTSKQLIHYRDKEMKKRWQQLRWASVARQLERADTHSDPEQIYPHSTFSEVGSSHWDADQLASQLSSLDVGEPSNQPRQRRRRTRSRRQNVG